MKRNNGIFKQILNGMTKELTTGSFNLLVARTSLIINLIYGISYTNAFQLAREYSPSIAGIPANIVTEDMLQAHIRLTASQPMQRAITSRIPSVILADMLQLEDKIWVFHKSSPKHGEPMRWLLATVSNPTNHYVECERKTQGLAMRVAYEHIRLAPNNQLAEDMVEISLEDEISDKKWNGLSTEDNLEKSTQGNIASKIFGDNDENVSDVEELRNRYEVYLFQQKF